MELVEILADESSFDQSCAYGNRVESHSVYCHNDNIPCRKCRRTWYTGGKVKDEDCSGYKNNDNMTGENHEKDN